MIWTDRALFQPAIPGPGPGPTRNVHVVLNTYDLLGPNSPTVLFATEKFRNDNPKTYKAFVDALTEAARLRPER